MLAKKLIQNELKLVKFTNQDSEMMQEGGGEAQDHMWEKSCGKDASGHISLLHCGPHTVHFGSDLKQNQFSVSIKKLHI